MATNMPSKIQTFVVFDLEGTGLPSQPADHPVRIMELSMVAMQRPQVHRQRLQTTPGAELAHLPPAERGLVTPKRPIRDEGEWFLNCWSDWGSLAEDVTMIAVSASNIILPVFFDRASHTYRSALIRTTHLFIWLFGGSSHPVWVSAVKTDIAFRLFDGLGQVLEQDLGVKRKTIVSSVRAFRKVFS